MGSIKDILNARFTLTDEQKKRRRRIIMLMAMSGSGGSGGEEPEPEPDPVLIQAMVGGSTLVNMTGTRQALMGDTFVNETTL